MYAPSFFKPDRAASLAFAAARGFGTVCAYDGAKPVASALPFCLEYLNDGTPAVAFHVARGNALAALADGKSNWLIAVNGADTYVSPHWYASPDQVPTWLYQAVHLSVRFVSCPARNWPRILTRSARNSKAGLRQNHPGRRAR